MESGRYISWFSSTFSAVSFFSEPVMEQSVRGVQLGAPIDYHSVFHHKEEYPLQESIGLIQTVINTLIRLVEIYSDSRVLYIWPHLF